MMIGFWNTITIRDLLSKGEVEIKTGPFGTQLHASDYVAEGTPVINARNIGFGDIRTDKLEYISQETVDRLSSHLLLPDDIVFGRKGTVERHAFIQEKHRNWFQGTDCLRIRLMSPSIEPRFFSYFLLTNAHKQWIINQSSHGATMTSLNQDIIGRITLPCPPLPTQRKIAAILSAYDDLIENNTRRIKILEEMAQALYREWFVHFRFPGYETVKMVETELGLVPEGWEIKKLGEIAHVNPEAIKKGFEPDVINYVDIASVSPGRIDKIEAMRFADAPGRARRIVQHGDVIWSCVRPNRKSYSLIISPVANMIVSTGFAVLRPRTIPFSYLYHSVTANEFVNYLANHATGAAYPAVNQVDFENSLILLPPKDLYAKFHRIVEDFYFLADNLNKKNVNIQRTRDLLLPKLISGEVDVSEVEVGVTVHE